MPGTCISGSSSKSAGAIPGVKPQGSPVDQEYWSLKVFCAVAEEQSVTLAAKRLTLGQPGVSMAIQRLEKRWGAKLVERRGRRVFLTEAGAALYGHALRTLRSARDLEDRMGHLGASDKLAVRVLTRGTLSFQFIPRVLARFWKQHPDVRVEVRSVGGSLVYLRDVLDAPSQFAVLTRGGGVIVSPGVMVEEIGREPRIVVAAPSHPLARSSAVSLAELAQQTFVVGSRQSPHILALREQFNAAGLQLRIAVELTGDGARTLVKEGVGVGLMLRVNVEEDLMREKLCCLDVPELSLSADLLLGYRDDWELDDATLALMQFMRSYAAARQSTLAGGSG